MDFYKIIDGYVFVREVGCRDKRCKRRIPLALMLPQLARLAGWRYLPYTFEVNYLEIASVGWHCPEHAAAASVPEGYFAEPCPSSEAHCSDNDCPCGSFGAPIPRGTG